MAVTAQCSPSMMRLAGPVLWTFRVGPFVISSTVLAPAPDSF